MKIYKYKIEPQITRLELPPAHAHILSACAKGDDAYIWALVDPDVPLTDRVIGAYATGYSNVPVGAKFIDTVHFQNGLVFHIFEVK
jgi:hypothetical protein